MKILLRIFQWLIGISFLLNGMLIAIEGYIIGLLLAYIGLLTLPLFYDWINLDFGNTLIRRIFKVIILIIGLCIIESVSDTDIKNESYNTQLSVANLSNQINAKGIENVDRNYMDSIQSIINKNRIHLSDSIILFSKGLDELLKIVPSDSYEILSLDFSNHVPNMVQMDRLQNGEFVSFLQDSILNIEYNRIMSINLPKKKDFSSTVDYFIFRSTHAFKNGYPLETTLYLDSILLKTSKVKIDAKVISVALSNSKLNPKQFRRIRRYVDKWYKENIQLNKSIAAKFRNENDLSNSFKYYSAILKLIPSNPEILTQLALISNERKHKKSAVRYLEKLKKLDALNDETCNLLRELTRYFSHWTYYSNCCDGSTSSSTGRGTCSHHGGVCSTGKSPNYRYKYGYCN